MCLVWLYFLLFGEANVMGIILNEKDHIKLSFWWRWLIQNHQESRCKSIYATWLPFFIRVMAATRTLSTRHSWPIGCHGTCFEKTRRWVTSICLCTGNPDHKGREVHLWTTLLWLFCERLGRVGSMSQVVGRHEVVMHVVSSFLQVFIWVRFPSIVSKPIEFPALITERWH